MGCAAQSRGNDGGVAGPFGELLQRGETPGRRSVRVEACDGPATIKIRSRR
jgi:hypothetical protein